MIWSNPQKHAKGSYKRYITRYAKRNMALLILSLIFISGVLAGAIIARTAGGDNTAAMFRILGSFMENRRDESLFNSFVYMTASSLIFVTVLFVCGFCAVSQPLIISAPFFRGLGFGFSSAALYMNYGLSATGFLSLLVIPDMLISTLALLLCCRESLRLSGNILGLMRGESKKEDYPLKLYLGRYAAASVLCVISAFIESVLHFSFANYFILG